VTSPAAGKVLNRKFAFPDNDRKIESLALTSSDSGKTLTITARMNGKDVTIPCGYQEWKKARAPLLSGGGWRNFPTNRLQARSRGLRTTPA
jgi:hypothetical protein